MLILRSGLCGRGDRQHGTRPAPHDMLRFVTWRDAYHESLNDTGRDEIVKDLVAWLDAALVV